ncbi:MraY family glycosyltransferase [Noviherbaspirillum aridicola]|uniref:Glycosyl transferase n=1 Tax=Noviherbaspirillum aridicola TaxID=2849687 RepID=A0ABQ4Q2E7_9BURK|nr:glycosyltransferase [Noviherbaspirillum aridicola]GIZ51020.1 glycosyl transferase [Noviherbaspirillum aridicola]
MSTFLIAFIISALLSLFIIRYATTHSLDHDLKGVQKFHARAVPRVGGVAIFMSVIATSAIATYRSPGQGYSLLILILCSSIAFFGGVIEDLTKRVSAKRRLLLTMLAAGAGYWLLDARIQRVDFVVTNFVLLTWVALPLTVVAVAGVANAVNIIDGFNGLAAVVTMFMLLSLAYVALQVNDTFVLVAAVAVAGAAAGFLVWNYPAGLIFLGDGGAYFLGFMLAELTVLLVMRNPSVSSWYALLLVIYPVFETLFSVYRRLFVRGRSPGMPDGIHLHSLIFRRIVVWAAGRSDDVRALNLRNSMTSPYLWLLSLLAVIPASLFWWHTPTLMGFCLLFVVTYVWLYVRIVRFRSPRWLFIRGRKR